MILHNQASLTARPFSEISARQEKLRRRHKLDPDAQFAAELLDGLRFKEGVRLGQSDFIGPMLPQMLGYGLLEVESVRELVVIDYPALLFEIARKVSHRAINQDELELVIT